MMTTIEDLSIKSMKEETNYTREREPDLREFSHPSSHSFFFSFPFSVCFSFLLCLYEMENHQIIACPLETGSNGAAPPAASAPPPLPPKPVLKSCEPNNPYQTTFVQVDASSFKQVVQMLTGTAETASAAAAVATSQKQPVSPGFKATGPKKPAFKLYERRNGLRNLSHLSPLALTTISQSSPGSPVCGAAAGLSPRRQPDIMSPSKLDFPSLVLSPVTPLSPDPFNRTPHPNSEAAKWAEDRAIAEKGFYLHPSPRTPTAAEPPQLLPLFPVTSPKFSSDLSLSVSQSFGAGNV
ncbi:VQ motif-containing protein 4-like [Curcuma longa]|uniref:VQ motif-containing protein 4-like n=1 Tax=Curcuma longa TaxID=136217 RepID=UPI003D9E23A7